MPTLNEIITFLDAYFDVERYPGDQNGMYIASDRPVQRVGLALEAGPALAEWVERNKIDALFLHRPWKLETGQLPEDIGVLSYHLAFDEHLTIGYNPRLADVLQMQNVEPFGEKDGRLIGMTGDMPSQSFTECFQTLQDVFGGADETRVVERATVTRIAVIGAMTDALVREAAEREVDVYVTGQFRAPARIAIQEMGMGVVAVGHRRSEEWGLRALAGLLCERWHDLEVEIANL